MAEDDYEDLNVVPRELPWDHYAIYKRFGVDREQEMAQHSTLGTEEEKLDQRMKFLTRRRVDIVNRDNLKVELPEVSDLIRQNALKKLSK